MWHHFVHGANYTAHYTVSGGCALGLGVFHARRQLGLTAVSVAVFAVVCARCVGAVACSPVGMVPTFKPL